MEDLLLVDAGLLQDIRQDVFECRSVERVFEKAAAALSNHDSAFGFTAYISEKDPRLRAAFAQVGTKSISTKDLAKSNRVRSGQGHIGQLFSDDMQVTAPFVFMEDVAIEGISPWYELSKSAENVFIVPLVGENRLLGAAEFVNVRIGRARNKTLTTLLLVGEIIARAITSLIRIEFLDIIRDSSLKGMSVVQRLERRKNYLKFVCSRIVSNDLVNFSAAILRVCDSEGVIEIEQSDSTSDVDWKPYHPPEELARAGMFGKSFNSGEIIEVPDISREALANFSNKKWIQKNSFRSYICAPIFLDQDRIGTLSLFLRYPYKANEPDHCFLSLLVHSIAKTMALDISLAKTRRAAVEAQGNYVREISKLQSIKEFAHVYKNDLRLIEYTLRQVIPTLTKGRTDELRKILGHIEGRRESLDDYIQSSRGDIGQKEAFRIEDVLRDIIDIYKSETTLARIRVSFDQAEETPYVYMNRGRLFEAVSNIYQNAIKACALATSNQQKSIELFTYVDSSTDDYCIQITDNGVGISSSHLPFIFDEGVSSFPDEVGTGQGLFFSKRIMDELVGDIDVASSVGKGTTFTIRFPIDFHQET